MPYLEILKLIKTYLAKEMHEGKTEFRLVARSEGDETMIYIHPMDKDGDTLDLRWKE